MALHFLQSFGILFHFSHLVVFIECDDDMEPLRVLSNKVKRQRLNKITTTNNMEPMHKMQT
jgi:hypothetical protein